MNKALGDLNPNNRADALERSHTPPRESEKRLNLRDRPQEELRKLEKDQNKKFDRIDKVNDRYRQ